MDIRLLNKYFIYLCPAGGIAQLARAFDWQSKGQEFDSPYLHKTSII